MLGMSAQRQDDDDAAIEHYQRARALSSTMTAANSHLLRCSSRNTAPTIRSIRKFARRWSLKPLPGCSCCSPKRERAAREQL